MWKQLLTLEQQHYTIIYLLSSKQTVEHHSFIKFIQTPSVTEGSSDHNGFPYQLMEFVQAVGDSDAHSSGN